ncbi:MAG: hypothetical protein KI793_14325 [Rivularia sp. (in: Bacteria)]|nr:hypothetical protein [Rivularia sp. MS3]
MKKYICIIHIAAILLTGCDFSFTPVEFGDIAKEQAKIRNKFSNYLEGCQEFRADRDKFINCYQTALENDPSIDFNFDSEVRRAYLYWECNNMPVYLEQDKYEACIDNADSILKKEF